MSLKDYGWDQPREDSFEPQREAGLLPARVIAEERGLYAARAEAGELFAEAAGKLRGDGLRPAVGDWVALRPPPGDGRARIEAVLPRRSRLARKAAGTRVEEQVLAANVDTVFLVTALDAEFNLRRIERWLAAIWDGGAAPAILLNKADAAADARGMTLAAEASAPGVPVVALSALTGEGLGGLAPFLAPGKTVALAGSSGVGKSTLVNRLLGAPAQAVREVREDDRRGRHTTTARRLFRLEGGALLIDMPGLRELQLWDAEGGLEAAFPEIDALAAACRFRDCAHEREPGCALRAALGSGALDAERYASWLKLGRELAFLARKKDPGLQANVKRRWKRIHRQHRARRRLEDG